MFDYPVTLHNPLTDDKVKTVDALEATVAPPRRVQRAISLTPEEITALVPQTSFGAIALDIALGLLTHKQVAQAWDLSPDQLDALMSHDAFKEELARATAERERLREDSRGGMALRARLLAEAGLNDIYRLFKDPDTSAPAKLNIFNKFAELGQLEQPKQDNTQQPLVQITIGAGVRGLTLDHEP